MKTLRIAVATTSLLAIVCAPAVRAQAPGAPRTLASQVAGGYKPVPVMHTVVPAELGCHVETTPGKLTKVACLSAAEIAKYPPPIPCAGADGDAACGMQSTVTPAQQQFGVNRIPITEGFLENTLEQYGSSTDSDFGAGGYSVQLNTNYFSSTTTSVANTTGWIQFAFQNFPGGGGRFCIWNNHWTDPHNPQYSPVCTPYSALPLTARARFTVGGFVCARGCNYISNAPALFGWMHWDTLNANGTVCANCSSGTLWAVAPDTYGLAGNWLQVSGSLLGSGRGSKLTFSGNADDRNVLGATACPIPLSPGWTCNTPQLNAQYADTAGWVTGESNNLYYAPNPNWVSPQAPQSALNCSGGFCSLTAYEIFPE